MTTDRTAFTGRRSDQTQLMPTTTADAYEVGDELYMDTATNTARPASSQTDQLSELLNQQEFAVNRIGVAMGDKLATVAGDLMVDFSTSREYHVNAVSATYVIGEHVALNEDAAGTGLETKEFVTVGADESRATHVVVRDEPNAATRIKVRAIRSTINPVGGVPGVRAPSQILTMAGTVVLTSSSARFLTLDPDGAVRDLDLPAEADMTGEFLLVKNVGVATEIITIRNDAAGTVATIDGTEMAILWCDGTTWQAGIILITLT